MRANLFLCNFAVHSYQKPLWSSGSAQLTIQIKRRLYPQPSFNLIVEALQRGSGPVDQCSFSF